MKSKSAMFTVRTVFKALKIEFFHQDSYEYFNKPLTVSSGVKTDVRRIVSTYFMAAVDYVRKLRQDLF